MCRGNRRGPILWVDDHPENNEKLVALLTGAGCEIQAASSTAEVRELLGRRSYRLVISDMGRGDEPDAGLELVGVVRDLAPVVIFASVAVRRGLRRPRRELGAALCTSGAASQVNGIYQCLARP